MTWYKIIVFFIILLFLLSPLRSAQKEKAYQYKAKVFLVELQVSVFDKDGKFVEGLKPEDFIILDEGKEQKISHFDYVVHDRQNIDLITQGRPALKRKFILLFDLSFSSTKGLVNSRKAALDFIDMILPTDQVAVITFSSFNGLNLLVNFTSDKEQLRKAINTLGLKKAGQLTDSMLDTLDGLISKGGLSANSPGSKVNEGIEEILAKMMERSSELTLEALVDNYIKQFHRLGNVLNAIEGKKTIIYLSEGFDNKIITSRPGLNAVAAIKQNLNKMLERFSGSDCMIQAVDVGGLRSLYKDGALNELNPLPDQIDVLLHGPNSPFLFKEKGKTTLFYMANETGGILYENINDFSKAMDGILQSTSRYYSIGYYPKEIGNKGKFREIKVKVNQKDTRVITRKGYFEDKPYKEYSKLEKGIKLAQYIFSDSIYNDIQFDVSTLVFPGDDEVARIPIFLQLPGKQFLAKKVKKQRKLGIYGYLINDTGVFKDLFSTQINIDANRTKDRLESHGIKYFDMLLAPPGKHRVKLIVQDSETGEAGTRLCSITVPDYKSKVLAMTPPIFIDKDREWLLSRGYNPNKPEGRKAGHQVSYPFTINNQEFIPAVLTELKVGKSAQFCMKVYNLTLHPEAKIPQTEMNFQIIDAEGKFHQVQKISIINKPTQDEENCFELVFQLLLDEHPPGRYQFKVTVADKLAGKKVQSISPFVLKP